MKQAIIRAELMTCFLGGLPTTRRALFWGLEGGDRGVRQTAQQVLLYAAYTLLAVVLCQDGGS